MALEILKEQLEAIIESGDKKALHEFLDQQNISDVADMIYELPDYDSEIIAAMSVHRAVGVFKILDFASQKKPSYKPFIPASRPNF
jgi:magnesium transporter